MGRLCENCMAVAFTRCGICKITYYCSKECQKKNWPFHKKFCAPTRKERLIKTCRNNIIRYKNSCSRLCLCCEEPIGLSLFQYPIYIDNNKTYIRYCQGCYDNNRLYDSKSHLTVAEAFFVFLCVLYRLNINLPYEIIVMIFKDCIDIWRQDAEKLKFREISFCGPNLGSITLRPI